MSKLMKKVIVPPKKLTVTDGRTDLPTPIVEKLQFKKKSICCKSIVPVFLVK